MMQLKNNIFSVDYARLSTYIVKGIQEQNQKIRNLEKELRIQKEKTSKLEKYFKEEIKSLREEFLNR